MNRKRRLILRGGATAIPWYLSGGISAANCIGAYKPKGAASLAASYTNLANPGTYTASFTGVTPLWSAANGWELDGTEAAETFVPGATAITAIQMQYTWSIAVRYSNANIAMAGPTMIILQMDTGGMINVEINTKGDTLWYADLGFFSLINAAGIIILTPTKIFQDGVLIHTWGAITPPVLSGRLRFGSTGYIGNINAVSVYNTDIAASGVDLSVAMAAL